MTPGRAFAVQLRAAMRRRRMTTQRLADQTGVSYDAIARWRGGSVACPSLPHALAVSEALMWPSLARIVTEARTKTCDVCGHTFVDGHRQNTRRRCSQKCNRAASWRLQAGYRVERGELTNRMARSRLRIYADTVDAFCRSCEPGGMCLTADCPIQVAGLSPLPLVRLVESVA